MADENEKKSRKAIALHSRFKMIKLSDESLSQAEISPRVGFSSTTVNSVIKNKQKILLKLVLLQRTLL
jgi:hypothetical protein